MGGEPHFWKRQLRDDVDAKRFSITPPHSAFVAKVLIRGSIRTLDERSGQIRSYQIRTGF